MKPLYTTIAIKGHKVYVQYYFKKHGKLEIDALRYSSPLTPSDIDPAEVEHLVRVRRVQHQREIGLLA